jgi:hypothetical protein
MQAFHHILASSAGIKRGKPRVNLWSIWGEPAAPYLSHEQAALQLGAHLPVQLVPHVAAPKREHLLYLAEGSMETSTRPDIRA